MVFETALALVLEKFLSKYVENFDRDKLKVGLWGGDVVLSNLKLKDSALDELDLPVRCCYGYLEHLILKIPWKNIYNEPCIAEIDGLYLLAIPNQQMKYNEEQEKKYAKEVKHSELEKVENAKLQELEKDVPSASSPEKKGFFEKLAANIIKNIQINIKNIHVRYEDRTSNPGKPFSIGITLDSLAIKSIPTWGEALNIDPLNLIYKELSINWLCIYWNSELTYGDLYFINIGLDKGKILNGLQSTIGSSTKIPINFKYLLGPINAKANLRINSNPETDGTNFTVPKFLLRLDLEKLYIRLSKRQYQDITCFLNTIDSMSKATRYRKYRPAVTSVIGHGKQWWKFAYTCIVEDEIRRVKREWDWDHIRNHRKLVKEYYQAYRERLLTPKPSKDLLAKVDQLEEKLDLFNIVLARQRVEMEFTREQLLRLKKGGPLEEKQESGGWRSWFGGGKKAEAAEGGLVSNISANFRAAMTDDEKNKLFHAIGYSEGEAPAIYPEEFVEADLGVKFHEISLEFIDEKLLHPTVMTVSLRQVVSSIKQWPTIKGLCVEASISDFIVHGIEQSKTLPKLISTTTNSGEDNYLLQVSFEINPLDKKVDKRVQVFMEPISVIYDAKTINSLLDVFQTNTEIPSAIQVAAQEKLKEFKEVSSLGLQHMLEVRETIAVNVDIKAPRVFIPHGGYFVEGDPVLVITLGNIKVTTLPRTKYVAKDVALLSEADSLKERIRHSYDNFILKLSDLQVVFAMKGEKWSSPVSDMYFLNPTSLDIDFGKCILLNDPNLPKIKIKAQLPIVEMAIYEARLKSCLALLTSIPLPSSEEAQEVTTKILSKTSVSASLHHLEIIERGKKAAIQAIQSYEEIVQFYEMECTFELQEVLIVILAQPTENKMNKFLQFRLNQLEASMEKHSFNTNIRLTLSSILLQQNYEENWIDMVFTPRIQNADHYLFRVNMTMVERNSPELHTKYKSTLQMIDVDFTKLELLLHCEALRALKSWADDFIQAIAPEETEKDTLTVRAGAALADSITDLKGSFSSLTKLRPSKALRPHARIEFVMMKLNGLLGEISITLWQRKEKFASLGISGGACDVTVKKSYSVFEMTLNGVYMNDHEPGTLYPKILTIKDKTEMITMKVVSFNNADRNLGSVDLTVKLSMARLHFVFLNGFLMRLLDFLNHFSEAREKIVDASQAAAEAAKQNVKSAYENAIRIGLDIDLKAPLIVVPVNKKSYEAFTLDLGHLTANNSFLDVKVPNASDPAVLDRLKVNLESLKFSRIIFDNSMEHISKEDLIIQPVSFKVTIQRNLSSGWFLDLPDLEIGGKLQSIKVSMTDSDYYLLMKTLEENIGDSSTVKPPPPSAKKPIAKITEKEIKLIPAKKISVASKEMNARATLRFALTLESVILELYRTDPKLISTDGREGLARVTLDLISLKGSMMSDESLHVALILLDCIMDDIRPGRAGKINRYMERKKDVDTGEGDKTRSMVDITFQQNHGAMFADIRVTTFTLMLNVEHLTKIASFFTTTSDVSSKNAAIKEGTLDTKKSPLSEMQPPGEKVKLTLYFKCEHPDIVLVEHIDSLETNAIVLDFEMIFSMRTGNDKTILEGSINELQLFSCAYNPAKRKETKCPILTPVTIILSGSDDNGSMKINVDSTRIKFSVSPGTVSLLSSIGTSLTGGEGKSVNEVEVSENKKNMWDAVGFYDSDYSFLKTELAVEAAELYDKNTVTITTSTNLTEMCVVKFPEIVIVMESGSGRTTMPILCLDSFIEVSVSNWSTKLHMEGKLMLQMKYFNHRHAIWEPLIEPVAVPDNTSYAFYNWTLNFVLDSNPEEDSDTSIQSIETDDKSKKPLMSISVHSPEMLNISVTKKSLEILKSIGTIMSEAFYKPEAYKGEQAPYVVKNDSGMSLKVILDKEFVVFPSSDSFIKDILLDVNSSVGLISCTEIEYLGISDETKEKYIHIMIPSYNCNIHIPVMKAAKRFFLLNHRGPGNDQWGIVSDVTVINGQTVITLRGIIQVENSFNMPINIYSMTNKENELHLIGTVEPSEKMNIPIDAIYTHTTELFFSIEGYTVSIVPYIWKALQNCVQKTEILRCNPKGEDEQARGIPLFLRATGELEQIYFENSSRHTILSTCFNISIRPTVIFKNILPVDIIVCMEGIVDEHTLTPGQSIQVPTAEPGSSHIVVRIPNYLDREWSSKNLIEESPSELNVWTFSCYENSTLKMELGAHVVIVNGTHTYSLYCPFWMLNKTGLRLAYKQGDDSSNLLYHPGDYNGIIMFSFKAKSFFAKKKSSIRVDDGTWSDKFSLDTTGTSGIVICKLNHKTYHIGVQIRMLSNALTKEVIFTPFHIIANSHKLPIEVREVGKEQGPWHTVPLNDCIPFWPTTKPDVGRLQVRIAETAEHTDPFPYFKNHNSVLKLDNKYGAINVDIHITEGGVFISIFAYELGMAPVLLVNHTNQVIDVSEKSAKDHRVVLEAKQQALFTWTTFDDNHILTFLKGKYSSDLKEDSIGNFAVGTNMYYWSTFLYGLQRVFLFTHSRSIAAESINLDDYEQCNQEIDVRVHGLGVSLVDDTKKQEIMYISISGSEIIWESRKVGKKTYKRFSAKDINLIENAYQDYLDATSISLEPNHIVKIERLTLDFKHMLLLSPSEKEIRRSYVEGLWANIKTSNHLTRTHLKVNRLQVDQQIYDCIFPVIFAPVPPPKSVVAEGSVKPFIEVSILKLTNQYSYVPQFKYFGILIQEFHVRVDTGLLTNLMGLFEESEASDEVQKKYMEDDIERSRKVLNYFVARTKDQEAKNYYGKLHLSPLKIHLSFSLSGGESGEEDKSSMPPIFNLILRSLGVTLTDINDVIFKINYFQGESMLITQSELLKEVQSHYTSQILQQLYVFVLGLDVIGNPFGLLLGFKQGATDLFYEPFQGAIRGPGEFAEGLVLGVRSLVGHTVGGTAGAISKMTGAVGKGLAALTFDDDYQRQRRDAQRQRPGNVQESLARGGKGLVMGVFEGIGGVVTKPISGAKEEGVSGFFKGVGKGVVGLVARPTAGIVDFASGSLGAVRRATEIGQETARARTPRYIRPDGIIRPFSPKEAEGNKHLQQLEKGKYSKTDEYIFHMNIGYAVKNKDILLLTDMRILYLAYNEIFGGYQLEWEHKWSEIVKEPELTSQGVRFWTSKQKSIKSIFASSDPGKVLMVDNPEVRRKLAELMKEQIDKVSPSHQGPSRIDFEDKKKRSK